MNQSSVTMNATDIVYITAEAIVGLVTVIGNSLVLAAIVKSRRLHTITNVFVGNLAIADIVVGILVAPSAALSFKGIPKDFYGCIFINCLILMFTNVSILMLLSVAFERFLAIKEPFLYHRLLSVRRAIYTNVCVWVVGSVLGLMPMYGWHGNYREDMGCRFTDVITYEYMVYFQFFGLVLLPLSIMLCIYIYILIIVRRHLRQTSVLHNRFQQNGETSDGFHKDVRAAKMFAMVILMFAIFWFPVNIFNCVSLFCGSQCYFPSEALLVAVVMSHANSSINPFLYATSNSRIKGAIKELFGIKLSPDERSSTDHNLMRHPPNDSPSARDNNVVAIPNGNHSPNFKDDSNPFIISHNRFRPDTDKMTSTDSNLNDDEDYDIMLQPTNHDTIRRDVCENSNNQSPNHHPQPSQFSLSMSTMAERPPEYSVGVSTNQQCKAHDYTQTCHIGSQEDAFRLSTTPPLSPLSDIQSHCRDPDDPNHLYSKPITAFATAEPFGKKEHGYNDYTSQRTLGTNIPDCFDFQQKNSFERDHNDGGHIQADDKRCSRKHLWCWNVSDQDVQNSLVLKEDPHDVCKCQNRNSSSESKDILMMNRRNDNRSAETTFSSISTHSITSVPKSPTSVEQDLRFSDKTKRQIDWEQQLKSNTDLKSNGKVNEYGVLYIDTKEQTQL
ncbi:unnamed protein product [Candidula unifasciata]|uniref:G-protein coupled receptors family 1 profile domain-containing protein n=1 Tax=Candidula unifasciata TaxID=100452 RepID=A0A8S3ZY80_9EUPU|nr:unnamed protein product [Candidula unifasciata]